MFSRKIFFIFCQISWRSISVLDFDIECLSCMFVISKECVVLSQLLRIQLLVLNSCSLLYIVRNSIIVKLVILTKPSLPAARRNTSMRGDSSSGSSSESEIDTIVYLINSFSRSAWISPSASRQPCACWVFIFAYQIFVPGGFLFINYIHEI